MKRIVRLLFAGTATLMAAALLAGFVSESVIRSQVRSEFPVAGRMIDIGDRSIQLDCRGAGTPTVVLESGLDVLGSLSWSAVHDSLAAITRTCAYSRAGMLWSDPSNVPFSTKAVAHDLHAMLAAAGESAPLVLVGHSIGGLYVAKYRELFSRDVVGMVLVDASHPGQVARMEAASGASMAQPMGLLKTAAALAPTGLLRMLAPPMVPPRAPAVTQRTVMAFVPMSARALVNESRDLASTFADGRSSRDLGDLPLVVLSAGAPKSADELKTNGLTEEQGRKLAVVWDSLQTELAQSSTSGRHESLADASHSIQFDRPDVVVSAVREVVGRVRNVGAKQ